MRKRGKIKTNYYLLIMIAIISIPSDLHSFGYCRFFEQNKQNESKKIVSDSCKSCDFEILKYVNLNINNLDTKSISKFLLTLSDDCNNNIEFLEFYNELLFKVLEKYPSQFIDCISIQKKTKSQLILYQLSYPLVDVDFNKLLKIVQNVSINNPIKKNIVDTLKKSKKTNK